MEVAFYHSYRQHDYADRWQQQLEPPEDIEMLEHPAECCLNGKKAKNRIECFRGPIYIKELPRIVVNDQFSNPRNNSEHCIDEEPSESRKDTSMHEHSCKPR